MKKFFIIFLILTCMLGLGSSAFAMTPTYTNNAKYSRGVSNTCYYVDSTASSYTSQVNSAAQNWEVTGYGWNPIYMTAVSSNYATHMDFYSRTPATDSYLNSTVMGYATFFNSDGSFVTSVGDEPTYNYFYSELIFNSAASGSYDYRTAKHEMGHAFGLDHTINNYSIMYPNLNDMYVSTVQQVDHDTINYLYN